MEELYLTYVHKIGFDFQDVYYYEFIFSDAIDTVDGDEWDSYPAGGNPSPPNEEFIQKVGKISINFKLDVAQDNELYSMHDCMDNIIPLAWENIDGLEEYPLKRVVFPFGMSINEVEEILYSKDIRIKFKTIKNEEN